MLRASTTGLLLAAVFLVALAYGVQLPLLPSLLERQFESPSAIAWHTGALTGVYTFALFLFAPAWGHVADRWQRRGVILIGLVGFAVALAVLAFVNQLAALYAGRFLSGAFSAAIVPASQALIADVSPDEGWRARRFAWLNIAGIAGFLVGPVIGGALGNMWTSAMPPSGAPFLSIAAASGVIAFLAWRALPRTDRHGEARSVESGRRKNRSQLCLLLIAASLLAVGLGVFEVGLALIGEQELKLSPARLGTMFTECMLVMATAQLLVFNPWFPPRATRWLLAPAFGVLAAGLLLLSSATSEAQLYWGVAAVAGAAGILSPVIGFWVSLAAGKTQGSALGWQTSASSIGQTIGSAMTGIMYGGASADRDAFLLAVAGALVGAVLSCPLIGRLTRLDACPPVHQRSIT